MKPIPNVRNLLTAAVAGLVPEKEVAVALSGGVDSTAVALACRDLGKTVTAFSFTLDDRVSSDFSLARANAKRLGFPFVPVFLPTALPTVKRDVQTLIRTWGLKKKTGVECAWPYLYTLGAVRDAGLKVLVTGAAADGHFGVSKKAMIHHRGTVRELDDYRLSLFNNPDYAQTATVGRIGTSFGARVVAPWRHPSLVNAFLGTSWEQVNKPRQKEPARASWPELAKLDVMKLHTNLQLGDSGIAENFEQLLRDPELNPGGKFKSVVAIYNRIAP